MFSPPFFALWVSPSTCLHTNCTLLMEEPTPWECLHQHISNRTSLAYLFMYFLYFQYFEVSLARSGKMGMILLDQKNVFRKNLKVKVTFLDLGKEKCWEEPLCLDWLAAFHLHEVFILQLNFSLFKLLQILHVIQKQKPSNSILSFFSFCSFTPLLFHSNTICPLSFVVFVFCDLCGFFFF